MSPSPSIYFTMSPGPKREELWSPEAISRAADLGYEVRLNSHPGRLTAAQWADELCGVEALITTWGAPRLDAETLSRNSTLRIVAHAAGSVAPVVSPELFRRGVRVVTANAEMARSVAEWGLMMTMLAIRRLTDYAGLAGARRVNWAAGTLVGAPHQAVVGIWGWGDVARRLVALLRVLEPREILVHDPWLTPEEAARAGVAPAAFEDLFARCDVVHLLTGMTPTNRGRVGAAELASMRAGAALVNSGRAHLVDEAALVAELSRGRIRAILDVFHTEPLPADSPLHDLPNVLLTPHCAGRGRRELYVPLALDEFDRFFRGEPLRHEITEERARHMTGGEA